MNNISQETARKLHWLALLLLFIVPFAVFSPALGWGFTDFDDGRNIYENPHIASLSAANLKWMFTNVEYARRYLPFGWLAYAVDQHFFGLYPFTYHFGNLLLHAVNTVLVYVLLRRLLELGTGAVAFAARPLTAMMAPALTTLLWALNPLRVESVAWSCGRIYLVATALFLGALLAYLRGAREERAGRSGRWWRSLAVAAYLASLLTYPIVLLGAWIFLLLEIFPLRHIPLNAPWRAPRRVWQHLLPFIVVAGAVLGLTLWCNFYARENALVIKSLPNYGTPAHKFMQAFFVWAYYLWKPWLPFNLAPHPNMLLSFNPFSAPFLASVAGVMAITIWVWRRRAEWPAVCVAWLAHLGLLVPMLGLTENRYYPADRYHYVIGLIAAALIAGALWKWWNRFTARYLVIGVTALIVAFAGLSAKQLPVWRNAVTLRQCDAERAGQTASRAHADALLGAAYLRVGSNALATAACRAALARHPNLISALDTLGDIAQAEGQFEEAVLRYDEVLRLEPNSLATRINRGVALGQQGKIAQAVAAFHWVVDAAPENVKARQNLTVALELQGRTNEARLVAMGKLPPLQSTDN
jgi:protein O-mannosyl-transferase